LRSMRNHVPFYAGRLWLGAWFPNAWAGEPNFDEAQMEVDYFKFTPFDEAFECPAESYPDFGWAPGTDVTMANGIMCGSYTLSPMTPGPTQHPTPAVTNPPAAGSYLDDGCANLPASFCATYCKDYQSDSCGRSVCHGDSHSSLNPCPGTPNPTPLPTPSPVTPSELEMYLSGGCAGLPETFCYGHNRQYCKSWQADDCGRSVCQGDSHSSLDPC
jgi:hypothetical protein